MGAGSEELEVVNENEVAGVSISSVWQVFSLNRFHFNSSRLKINISSPQTLVMNLKNQFQEVKRCKKALMLA